MGPGYFDLKGKLGAGPDTVSMIGDPGDVRIQGVIRPGQNTTVFDRASWCELVARRPEFHFSAPVPIKNPFTGEPMAILPREGDADIMLETVKVGRAYWSMSEESLVIVDIDPEALSLVREWVAELGGEFHEEPTLAGGDD